MDVRRIALAACCLLACVACEQLRGPPMGPQDERGERIESGMSAFTLIEVRLNDEI